VFCCLAPNRQSCLKKDKPSSLTPPVVSRARAQNLKLVPSKLGSYFLCFLPPESSAGASERTFFVENEEVTQTSTARPLESCQQGKVTSPGRRPGFFESPRMPLFSNTGDKSPSSPILDIRFRMRLWRTMTSPFFLQHAAWSPSKSKGCMQKEQVTWSCHWNP